MSREGTSRRRAFSATAVPKPSFQVVSDSSNAMYKTAPDEPQLLW